jgi:hypothetical protein
MNTLGRVTYELLVRALSTIGWKNIRVRQADMMTWRMMMRKEMAHSDRRHGYDRGGGTGRRRVNSRGGTHMICKTRQNETDRHFTIV